MCGDGAAVFVTFTNLYPCCCFHLVDSKVFWCGEGNVKLSQSSSIITQFLVSTLAADPRVTLGDVDADGEPARGCLAHILFSRRQ